MAQSTPVSRRFDVLIAGARCAGATLGALLARKGARVLMIDAAKLPSDMVLSTHYVQPLGMDVLDEIGVGDRVRAAAPASRRIGLAANEVRLTATYPDDRAGYCIRRFKIDTWLQEAAANAGVEVRDRCKLVELVREGDRVAGAVIETAEGRETVHADLVVGADGRNSTVAKQTGVEEYLGIEMTRSGYWGYWPMNEAWKTTARLNDALIAHEGDDLRYIFQADDDLLLLVATTPQGALRNSGKDHNAEYTELLHASAHTEPLVQGNAPVGKVIGLMKARFFCRRPVGPGFALIGDAGMFKDFVTGQGMTDAFLDAKRMAAAIADGRPIAFEHYWRKRDASGLPFYFDAERLGKVGVNDPLFRMLLDRATRSPELLDRLGLSIDRRMSPFDVFKESPIVRWTLGAVLSGRWDMVGPFFKSGRMIGGFEKEIAAREALCAEVENRMRAEGRPTSATNESRTAA